MVEAVLEIQGADETSVVEQLGLFIEVIFSTERPVVNTPWTISILVDYSHPEYVGAIPPEFPEALHFDEMRIEPLIREDRNRWTAVRWTFIPQSPESEEPIQLGSFQITVPGRAAFTDVMDVSILSKPSTTKNYRPRLVWDKIKTPFEAGVGGELILRLFDWEPSLPTPKVSLPVPEQAILEEIPLTQADIARSAILRLFLIPLTDGEIAIPRLRFKSEGANLEIPSLIIPTIPSVKRAVSPQTPETVFVTKTVSPLATVRFPEKALKIPRVFSRIATADIVLRAKTLWEHRERAEALALVRKNERDGIFGFAFAPLREDMEQALGLAPGHGETRIAKKVCLIVVLCGIAGLLVLFMKRKRVGKKAVFTVVLTILTLGGLAGFLSPFQQKTAVFHASHVYSVPEPNGVGTGRINEGQWAILRSISDDWVLVESGDLAGWVSLEKAIFY
jgi:hypothetical protein